MFNWMKKKKDAEQNSGRGQLRSITSAQLRLQKDLNDMDLGMASNIEFDDPNDLFQFKVIIRPEEGFYRTGKFTFRFTVGDSYPIEPPKVKCENIIFHPNIDSSGGICLNILREDWRPVFTITSIIHGLQFLLMEPNPDDPLNNEAAEIYKQNLELFQVRVKTAIRADAENHRKGCPK